MNSKTSIISVVILLLLGCISYGDGEFSNSEKESLFHELINNSRTTWIQAGAIEVTREQYKAPTTTDENEILSEISKRIQDYQNNEDKPEKAEYLQKMKLDATPFNTRYQMSNEYTMKTTNVLKYDGTRFYLDITVDSREDSVKLPYELKGNYKTEEFNMDWNSRRISCFDGEKEIMYTPSINHALIETPDYYSNGRISLIRKGIIFWGYGNLTYEKLTEMKSSVVEQNVDGRSEIVLTLSDEFDSESIFILDPSKDYAPISWVENTRDSSTVHLYSGYKLISNNWVPTSIIIEKFDKDTNELKEGDYLTITKISGEVPSSSDFVVDFVPDTLIEHRYDITEPQLIYFYANASKTDLLLSERKAYIESEGKRIQNCATSSLQFAALQLGKDILDNQLSEIVNTEDMTSSLKDMKSYAENKGFNCKAVTTDIQTLKDLSGCQAILHIPGKNHFVLLDHIDENYVWIIDLTENKFYYRISVGTFDMEWTEGTALLLSNQQISLSSDAVEINDDQLIGYTGGYGWACTYLLQSYHIEFCQFYGELCYGDFEMVFTRYGCDIAENGVCTDEVMTQKYTVPCRNDPEKPEDCIFNYEEKIYLFLIACQH